MKTSAFLLLVSGLFIACHSNGNIAGGPCSYKDSYHPITVVKHININPLYHDILFLTKEKDTLSYYTINRNYLDSLNLLKTGDTCWLKESNIVTGSCNPHILHIDTHYSK